MTNLQQTGTATNKNAIGFIFVATSQCATNKLWMPVARVKLVEANKLECQEGCLLDVMDVIVFLNDGLDSLEGFC